MKKYVVLLALYLSVLSIAAQGQDNFYKYYLKGDMKSWNFELQNLKLQYQKKPTLELLETIVFAQYGIIGYKLGLKEKQAAKTELIQAQKNMDKLINKQPYNPKYQALKGAFLGFELGIQPWKAMIIGPESQQWIEKALLQNSKIPQANFEYANMKFWAPALVGGNKEVALSYYLKTINLLEQQKRTNDWFYLWALTAYANALKKTDQMNQAQDVYKKILAIEPGYEWVAKELSHTNHGLPNLNFE